MLALDDVTFVGAGLHRPECVLATAKGDLYAADWRGGVSHLLPGGQAALYVGRTADVREGKLLPNGIALDRDGSFLLTQLGEEEGGVFRLHRDGQVRAVLREVDGVALPPTNFVLIDARGRVWITVSTRKRPRSLDYRADCAGGSIVLLDGHGARIVADGIGYANEVAIGAAGDALYVNETFGRRLSRYRVHPDGRLSDRQTVAEFGSGVFPDGLAIDVEGGLWVTSVVSNRIIRVAGDGRAETILEDMDDDHVAWVEAAYREGTLGRPHLDVIRSRKLRNVSSLAFGGPDLRTGYVGCLLGDAIGVIKLPVAGVPPVHWPW